MNNIDIPPPIKYPPVPTNDSNVSMRLLIVMTGILALVLPTVAFLLKNHKHLFPIN